MKYSVEYGNRAVALPLSAFDIDDPTALRLLMLLCSEHDLCESSTVSYLAERLGTDEKSVVYALELLIRNGLVREDIEIKTLSGNEIAEKVESDKSLRPLIDECASICHTVSFNHADMSRIISLKKELGMEDGAIILLFSNLAEYMSEKGERLTVAYATRAAYRIKKLTYGEMNEYLEEEHKKNSLELKLRNLFGLGNGKIPSKYAEEFRIWNEEYSMPYEMIEAAYDSAPPDKTTPTYISKILQNWHENGIKTPDEAKKFTEEYKQSDEYKSKFEKTSEKNTKKKNNRNEGLLKSFDPSDFFGEAMQNSFDNIINELNAGKEEK